MKELPAREYVIDKITKHEKRDTVIPLFMS